MWRIFGLNVLPMGVVLSDCPGSTEKSDQPSFPTQTHCKHSHLKLQIQLEEWIHLPVLLDKCCTRYNTHSILYSVHLYFCLSLHIFMLFFEKITSACKKLNKESEHKNFLYTYSWTCHVLLIQMLSDHLQKQKYRNIGNKLQNKNYKCIFFPHQS